MWYKSFRIRNFKGVKDTTVHFKGGDQVGVYTLVGLNESGKTTVLEAIHSFSPDKATSEVVGGDESSGIPYAERVPRHLLSNFSGDVSVSATVVATESDRQSIIKTLKRHDGIVVNEDNFPYEFVLERHQRFRNGDFVAAYFSLRTSVEIVTGKQKKWRNPSIEENSKIKLAIYGFTPDIAYFPTFVFNFPRQIFLTPERGGKVNRFYRQMFQDILDYDGQGHTIEESIVRRVRSDDLITSWLSFLTMWNTIDSKDKIQHVMDRAGAAVTKVVFGRWNKIFHDNAKGKEVLISFDTAEGEKEDAKGVVTKTNEHDVYIKFQVRDGTRRFDVNDRSLGFRWFFAFMMFTQFRVSRDSTRAILFLFDEPASNLHAAAQQKLIESFPEIAKDNHKLAYTTHSHYMIEPRWLEQAYIVTNRADSPPESMLEAISLNDESLDIKVTAYREFVNSKPGQTSYFQPILDRLDVVPSKFDIERPSLIVEGKSDFYVLAYARRLLGAEQIPIVPGLGAGTLGALISLHVGWGLRLLFVLDGDRKGLQERTRYLDEYGLSPDRIVSISDVVADLKEIEGLLDKEALGIIQIASKLDKKPTKNQIRRFFQERIANGETIDLGKYFRRNSKELLDGLKSRLDSA